ncbi:hypothetical protein COL940_008589 [Colletotrichum noveboracense]|nr:hypothetical protein COL940_008589 [Colletotrichum noveboracense]KAJ0281734.1 hypothetical protein CBS470a_008133 [Colletotrichum nupharicola]
MPPCGNFILHEATIDQMKAAMEAGTVTSQQLVACYLQRTYQTQEYVHSILQINPDVFQIAAQMDAERKAGKVRGPLHGIPFTVKDNIATKDNMETTAGSWALMGSIVPRDAHVVARLRDAGAVLLGKAALSEWADMRSNNYSEGVVPESEHQDTVGTFGRTVKDAVYAFDSIYGVDHRDIYTFDQEGRTPEKGYTQFLSTKESLKGATFGIPWNSFWVYTDDEQRGILVAMLDLLTSAGATIINNTEITDYDRIVSPDGWNWDYGSTRGYANESEYTVVKVDFYNNINIYLSELENTNVRSIDDIVQFNYDNDGTEGGNPWPLGHPAFYSGQDGFLASLESKGIKDEMYNQALEFTQRSTRDGIDAALTSTNGTKLSGLLVPPDVGQSYQIAAQAGYPMITLPVGVHSNSGMGFGLAIMQTAFGEAELVKWGSAIEDLQLTTEGNPYKRTLPTWSEYLTRHVPIRMDL